MYYYYDAKVLHPGKFDDSDYNLGKNQRILKNSFLSFKENPIQESIFVES